MRHDSALAYVQHGGNCQKPHRGGGIRNKARFNHNSNLIGPKLKCLPKNTRVGVIIFNGPLHNYYCALSELEVNNSFLPGADPERVHSLIGAQNPKCILKI